MTTYEFIGEIDAIPNITLLKTAYNIEKGIKETKENKNWILLALLIIFLIIIVLVVRNGNKNSSSKWWDFNGFRS